MKLQQLRIQNFKSIVNLKLDNPSPFSVFVGPNAAGKSNIFEALEWFVAAFFMGKGLSYRIFGGHDVISNVENNLSPSIELTTDKLKIKSKDFINQGGSLTNLLENEMKTNVEISVKDVVWYFVQFSRIFIRNNEFQRNEYNDGAKLSLSTKNLEKVLRRILSDEKIKEEFNEWLELFIPEFKSIEIHSDDLTGLDSLLIYERYSKKPFNKSIISDGTYNILSLLTSIFQSNEQQFLCIEEPENGLNPYVIRELVSFFRQACEDYGHYIWLNTHSQTLVSQLKEEEFILVEKIEGATQVRQFKPGDFYGLRADEAWLTNVLGGGNPW